MPGSSISDYRPGRSRDGRGERDPSVVTQESAWLHHDEGHYVWMKKELEQ